MVIRRGVSTIPKKAVTEMLGMIAGYVAGALSLSGHAAYIFGTLRRGNRPMLLTWGIWAFVDWGLFVSFTQSGAGNAKWLQLAFALGNTAVAALAVRNGGFRLSKLNATCLVLAVIAVVCLVLFRSPEAALLIGLSAKFVGYVPTFLRLYYHEGKEYTLAWWLRTVGNLINFLALPGLWTIKAILPLQYSTQCILVLVLGSSWWRKRKRNALA